MHIADYKPREELVHHLHQLYFEFDQPSADNLADWEKIAIPLTLKFPIYVSLSELRDFFEENRYSMTTPFYFQVITSVQNILVGTSYAHTSRRGDGVVDWLGCMAW